MKKNKLIKFRKHATMLNERVNERINELVVSYVDLTLTLEDLLDLEYKATEIFIDSFEEIIKDVEEYVDFFTRFSLSEGVLGIFPNNLFTALLTNNKYNGDISPKEIMANRMYRDLIDNVTLVYDRKNTLLKYLKVH